MTENTTARRVRRTVNRARRWLPTAAALSTIAFNVYRFGSDWGWW